jgi:hypothetical protein
MSANAGIPALERVVFFSGQRLLAGDLTEANAVGRELRWLHNRTLHQPGVAAGFEVTGEAGDTVVVVAPGFGLDGLGREVLLTPTAEVVVPAVSGAALGGDARFYLVARYVEDAEQAAVERRAGACHGAGSVRLSDDPALVWRPVGGVDEQTDVVLASIRVRNCVLSQPVSMAARRLAGPSQSPFIAAGEVAAPEWQGWQAGGTNLGLQLNVKTAAAHFRSTPQYLVETVGLRFLPGQSPVLVVGFPEVADATPDGFVLRVAFPAIAGLNANPSGLRDPVQGPLFLKLLKWRVTWTGVEA